MSVMVGTRVRVTPQMCSVLVFVRGRMFVVMRIFVTMGMTVTRAVGVNVLMLVVRRVVMVMVLTGVVMVVAMHGAVRVLVRMDMGMATVGTVLVRVAFPFVTVPRCVAVRGAVGVNVPVRIIGVLRRHGLSFDSGFAGTAAASRAHGHLL